MNDSSFHLESSPEARLPDDAPPEFGLVDVIEAFTAMRHEWREQIRESRAAGESVQAAASTIQSLEEKLLAHVAQAAEDTTEESKKLAELIADLDHQLARSVEAAVQSETNRRRCAQSDVQAAERFFQAMNPLARWFARPLMTFIVQRGQAGASAADNPAIEGLNLLLARFRRLIRERHIERLETLGEAFDATTMNAIGTVETDAWPPGRVAEQLSPCYRWRGRLLRFADVRVSAAPPP
jgi:molecular chaperone GrpE